MQGLLRSFAVGIRRDMRLLILASGLLACGFAAEQPFPLRSPEGRTISTRFDPPKGFLRDSVASQGFGAYLRALPLKSADASVHLFDGRLKARQDVHAAVIDLSMGTTDLQQCADAVMRLRAEHLFAQGRFADIHFDFTNGFRADFSRWANGERIQVQGNACTWTKGPDRPTRTHADLLAFLQQVFMYAGTLSLSKELKAPDSDRIAAGDVFIHGGSPGHAMIVVDVAHDAHGQQAFLLAQSYMPAQDIHVVRDLRHPEHGAWYISGEDDRLHTPEWTFAWTDRRTW